MNRIKTFLVLFLRTLCAILICALLWLISGKVFNFLPALFFVPIVVVYYAMAMLIYFVLASDDILSTIIGVLLSISFIVLYILNILSGVNLFVKVLFIIGIIVGIAQTIKSVTLRFYNGFSNNI